MPFSLLDIADRYLAVRRRPNAPDHRPVPRQFHSDGVGDQDCTQRSDRHYPWPKHGRALDHQVVVPYSWRLLHPDLRLPVYWFHRCGLQHCCRSHTLYDRNDMLVMFCVHTCCVRTLSGRVLSSRYLHRSKDNTYILSPFDVVDTL